MLCRVAAKEIRLTAFFGKYAFDKELIDNALGKLPLLIKIASPKTKSTNPW
jgi:hypothetical protein